MHSMKRSIAVNFVGVEEGSDFDYGSIEAKFSYCRRPLAIYTDKNEPVCFRHFAKPTPSRAPKSGYGILDPQLIDNLDKMKVVEMRPIQIATVMASFFSPPICAYAEPDFLGVSSTGSGKTHAFLVPMIQKCLNRIEENPIQKRRTPLVLIFAHSTSLAINIYQTALKLIKGTNVQIRLIAGGQAPLKDSYFDIGICTVGRFSSHFYHYDRRYVNISLDGLKYLVIDEADKLFEECKFLEIYQNIAPENPITSMLFTATANAAIEEYLDTDNLYAFSHGKANAVSSSVKQYFWQVDTHKDSKIYGTSIGKTTMLDYAPTEIPHPFDALYLFIMNKLADKKVIVFVKRTCVADIFAIRLRVYGYDSIAVHSKQPPEVREKYLQRFISGQDRILFATNLLTRGTDIHVDYVINYDLPLDYTDYVHRCGRTGRNGQTGTAITFVDYNNKEDYSPLTLQQIILNNTTKIKHLPRFMRDYAKEVKEIDDQKGMLAEPFYFGSDDEGDAYDIDF